MKFVGSLLFGLSVLFLASCGANSGAFNEMEYRGERIKLSRAYFDYDEYKNDPGNIDPSETSHVQKLVMEAPITSSFDQRIDVFKATGEIVFPGYGSGGIPGRMADGSDLAVVDIEVPRAEKERYILFRSRNGHYELVDDFVHPETALPYAVREESGSFVFLGYDGKELFRHTPKALNSSPSTP